MRRPFIPLQNPFIPNNQIQQDPEFQGLRIIRCQTDETAAKNYDDGKYEFQNDLGKQRFIRATLTRKGMVGLQERKERIAAYAHLSLMQFVDLVRYDPSKKDDHADDYYKLEMQIAHQQTQSDFQGQKDKNKENFKRYLLEGVKGYRPLYLPAITGWQSYKVFEETVFVALDESDPNALYGFLYLPMSPIMQSDGQTQTAALFSLANHAEAIKVRALQNLIVTLEIELNVDPKKAGQSFADRNGRGTKKDKNLVIELDQSSALSELRLRAVKGTVFENRILNGIKNNQKGLTGITKTSTDKIADLSTIEQMLLAVVFGNYREKAERFKHHHVNAFEPFVKEFFSLLNEVFSSHWIHPTPEDSHPFRMLYVHGWAFALKAIAIAYNESRKDQLKPLVDAMNVNAKDEYQTEEELFKEAIDSIRDRDRPSPTISFEELKRRLVEIDWHRHRKHWIDLTGYAQKKGKKTNFELKTEEQRVVVGLAPNTPDKVTSIKNKIPSEDWEQLKSNVNEPLD